MPTPLPASWASCDPGDIHIGFAVWSGSRCMWADELTVDGFTEQLEHLTGLISGTRLIEVLVQEKFVLYGWKASEQIGSEFLTSQLIGTSKYICKRAGVHYIGKLASQGKATYKRSPWIEWGAKDWRNAGARRVNAHVKDAMAHGFNFIWERDHER
jgi:hypothetical protein